MSQTALRNYEIISIVRTTACGRADRWRKRGYDFSYRDCHLKAIMLRLLDKGLGGEAFYDAATQAFREIDLVWDEMVQEDPAWHYYICEAA